MQSRYHPSPQYIVWRKCTGLLRQIRSPSAWGDFVQWNRCMGPSGSQRSLDPFISELPCTWSNSSGLLAICLRHTHKKMGGGSKRPNIFVQTQSLNCTNMAQNKRWPLSWIFPVNNVTAVLAVIIMITVRSSLQRLNNEHSKLQGCIL